MLKSSKVKCHHVNNSHSTKVESSNEECPDKYEQTQKLMLTCSNVPKKKKKNITENPKFRCCLLSQMNPSCYTNTLCKDNIRDYKL